VLRLKDFLHSNGFKVLLAVIFIMFGLMLYTASTGSSIFSNLMGFISAPMQKVSTVVANNANETAKNATLDANQLKAEYDELKKKNEDLNNKLVDYYQIKQENEQYKSILGLKSQHKDYQLVSAAVIGRDPNDLFYNFSVDKGSLDGVKVNDPVVTSAGLVGYVSSVNATYCKITTILSADTSIGASDKVTRDSGVVSSNIKLADQGLTKMGYLDANTKVKSGDIIVTSGLGGIYPKDLLIGTVTEVKNEEYDVSLCATVKPFVDVKSVHDVFIITKFVGQGEIMESSASTASSGGK
jgi:rod shape-determining protein MreC